MFYSHFTTWRVLIKKINSENCLPYNLAEKALIFKKCASITHNTTLIMGDGHKNCNVSGQKIQVQVAAGKTSGNRVRPEGGFKNRKLDLNYNIRFLLPEPEYFISYSGFDISGTGISNSFPSSGWTGIGKSGLPDIRPEITELMWKKCSFTINWLILA